MSDVSSSSDDQPTPSVVDGSIEEQIAARRADPAFQKWLDALFADEHEVFERLADE